MSLLDSARAIASDRDSGASEIVRALVEVLEEARQRDDDTLLEVVRVMVAGQPGMAPVWNACAAAVADLHEPGRLARFREATMRRQRALTRVAAQAIGQVLDDGVEPTIVTWSYSGSVAAAIREVASSRPVTAICAEGRPRLEGRRLASVLAEGGVHVVVTTDAGATTLLDRAAAVVVGADTLMAEQWVNKAGTRALTAVAAQLGRPVIVVASRDKALAPILEARLQLPLGEVGDLWSECPPGVDRISPLFERIPAELATWFATDAGLLTPSDLPTLARQHEGEARQLLFAMDSRRV